jgi:hypothetical protein
MVARLEIAVAAVAVMGAVAVQKVAAHKITDSESYELCMAYVASTSKDELLNFAKT